ncbi:CBS domain-containing protein CBSX1, chloroplastic-like protein [Haematococcus lacustris]
MMLNRKLSRQQCRPVRTSTLIVRAVAPAQPLLNKGKKTYETVADIMKNTVLYTCAPDDSVDKALELIVAHKVSGLPVVNQEGQVVGVVSDFDLLALFSQGRTNAGPLFPKTEDTWQAFREVKTILAKGTGKKVRDVMTCKPLTVKSTAHIDEATSLLLQKRIRRLPVVDDNGVLVGLVSRSGIVQAALELRKTSDAK